MEAVKFTGKRRIEIIMGRIARSKVRFFLQGDLLEKFEKNGEKGRATSICCCCSLTSPD